MDIDQIRDLIAGWRISQEAISSRMGMNYSTFKMKLSPSYPNFFTDDEISTLEKTLLALLREICLVLGLNIPTIDKSLSTSKTEE